MTVTPQSIFTAVTQVFPVKPEDLVGRSRCRNEVDARACVAGIAYQYLRMSNRQIADLLQRRGSDICIYYRRKFDALYTTDKRYRAMADQVIAALGMEVAA